MLNYKQTLTSSRYVSRINFNLTERQNFVVARYPDIDVSPIYSWNAEKGFFLSGWNVSNTITKMVSCPSICIWISLMSEQITASSNINENTPAFLNIQEKFHKWLMPRDHNAKWSFNSIIKMTIAKLKSYPTSMYIRWTTIARRNKFASDNK